MKRAFPILCALALASAVVSAAPVVNIWDLNVRTIWSDTLGQAGTDTVFTDSVNVYGSRAVTLLVTSDGSDSVSVPILQTKLPGSPWTYVAGPSFIPSGTVASTVPITATSLVSSTTRHAASYYNEFSSGGTPIPFTNTYFRWRIRAANVRGNNAAGKVPSGRITYTIVVMK